MWVQMRIEMPLREQSLLLENRQQFWAATRVWPLFAGGALDIDRDAPKSPVSNHRSAKAAEGLAATVARTMLDSP
jgi:hypothetical protein